MLHVRQDDFGFEAATARGRGGFLRRTWEDARAWLRERGRRHAERQAARRLAAMDEHLLRDIGVSREQAFRLARGETD